MPRDTIPPIPPVPRNVDADSQRWMEAVRQALIVRLGQTGNLLDRSPTLRELLEDGIATAENYDSNGNPVGVGGGGSGTTIINEGGGGGNDPFNDLRTPGAPTGLTVSPVPFSNLLWWNTTTDGTEGIIAFHEVWANTVDDLATAFLVGIANNSFVHPVEPLSTTYYWVRAKSYAGFYSAYNSVNGTVGVGPDDPASLLAILEGEISESELAAALSTRIDLIDTPSTGLLDRMTLAESEITTLDDDLATEISTRELLAAVVDDNSALISSETSARILGDQALASDVNQLQSRWSLLEPNFGAVLLLNQTVTGSSQPGEGSIVNKELDGSPAYDENAVFEYNGSTYTIDRGAVGSVTFATAAANKKGFLVYDTTESLKFTVASTPTNLAFVYEENGSWFYDPNTTGVAYTPVVTDVAIGWVETGVSDTIISGALINPVSITLASFPSADSTENSAAFQTLATTTAGPDGATAQYTVKVDTNGNVAGFGLSSTTNEDTADGSFSEFYVAVDRFAIVSPDAAQDLFFAVDSGKVVMDAAFIKDATITAAKIQEIDAQTITVGKIQATQFNFDGIEFQNVGGALTLKTINADKITTGEIATSLLVLDGQTIDADGSGRVHIPNAGVDTLQIAGQAVTVPVAGFVSWEGQSPDYRTLNGSPYTPEEVVNTGVFNLAVTTPMYITWAMEISGQNSGAPVMTVEIYRDGTRVFKSHPKSEAKSDYVSGGFQTTVAAGAHTLSMRVAILAGDGTKRRIYSAGLSAVGVQR